MVKYTSLLLVDDDVDDHEIFIAALESVTTDVNVTTAENGMLAFEMLQKKKLLLDLIFLDVNMPLMNRFQFLSEFKEQDDFIHIPVIMYSTTSSPETIERA